MRPSHSALALATVLGLLALVPFVAGVYYAYANTALDAGRALHWLLPYLATIVGFIGGVQWGRMLSGGATRALDMALAVVPALIAWAALLANPPWPTLLLLLALVVAWLADENGLRRGWQSKGFLRLRRLLTLVVGVAIAAIGWRVMRG